MKHVIIGNGPAGLVAATVGLDATGRVVTIAPSLFQTGLTRGIPKEMEDWDIERIVGDFGQAARRYLVPW